MLFSKEKTVLFFTKSKLVLATVSVGSNSKISNQEEFIWDRINPKTGLSEAIKKLKNKSIRLLFDDDLFYSLELSVPTSQSKSEETEVITQMFKEIVPEELGINEIQHIVKKSTADQKTVLAFTPIKTLFKQVTKILHQSQIQIEGVQPVIVAKMSSDDPIIGIATAVFKSKPKYHQEAIEEDQIDTDSTEKTQKKFPLILVIILILIVLLTSVGITYLFYDQQ